MVLLLLLCVPVRSSAFAGRFRFDRFRFHHRTHLIEESPSSGARARSRPSGKPNLIANRTTANRNFRHKSTTHHPDSRILSSTP
uniref:Putative secreted protein n=1 Tax=Anopheles marajoara TaxID=58244 RepID=A0A2M4CAW9_9DIPT